MAISHFEFERLSDGLVYRFVRVEITEGVGRYKREDADVWIIKHSQLGWIATDSSFEVVLGIPWGVAVTDQSEYPPMGEWVSKKGEKSYVYLLRYEE